jgi:2-keto-4-pentenoate hydratase/2-oxohepta-3-ene-1,7-dioic acid hydratase in catechol pathway
VGDPQDLALRLWVNGSLRQDGTTADMVFGVGHLIWYLSQFMVLEAGDVVNTGTPAGVAMGQPEPKPYLRAGDVVELEVSGLGRQRQVMTQA